MFGTHIFEADLYVPTTNQLYKMAARAASFGRPIVTVRLPTMAYTLQCMTRIKDDWYYFINSGVLIIAEFDRRSTTTFFCVNMSEVNICGMIGISDQILYGVNRSYALNGIVDTIKSEVVDKSYSYESLKECAEKMANVTDNIQYVGEICDCCVFSSHVLHKLMKYSFLMYVSRKNGYYCDYLYIRDDIVTELAKVVDNAAPDSAV